ncbi:MAG TPA: DinB family protein [Vicinamibacterales bacterium]|nr:DinB family protein [Vicinamibacterales bacterium]
MTQTELFLAELDRESDRSRRMLDLVPEGKYDWKPHERSMAFGYLAELVATMPSWVAMTVNQDELDLQPPGGQAPARNRMNTSSEFLEALDKAVADARAALQKTSDDYLLMPWRLLVGGKVVMESPRHEVIRETFNHLAHHRGQMTVYFRLMGVKVPALYGPSADDQRF